VTDVAEAGGWKDTATLLTCYAPANETLLAVMSEERKLRDCVTGARNAPTGPVNLAVRKLLRINRDGGI
jgi:hypothetical protein